MESDCADLPVHTYLEWVIDEITECLMKIKSIDTTNRQYSDNVIISCKSNEGDMTTDNAIDLLDLEFPESRL